MPRVMAGPVQLFYESLGEGTPMVLQAHDHTPRLFGQAPVFSQRYRFLAYDRRGTGRSSRIWSLTTACSCGPSGRGRNVDGRGAP